VLLDAATVWIVIRALGVTRSVGGVFVSSMIASLFRTMGIVPGGLGTFEATSVLMLRMVGIEVACRRPCSFGTQLLASDVPGILVCRRVLVA
jgi:hypothetical protein